MSIVRDSTLLEIRVKPTGTKVTCDGKPIKLFRREEGFDYFNLELKAGEHRLKVTKDGYKPKGESFDLVTGQRWIVTAELKEKRFPGCIKPG